MSKTIILYAKRNTGMVALLYLKAKGYNIVVADDSDDMVKETATNIGCYIRDTDYLLHTDFDVFVCVHGTRIFNKSQLDTGLFVNIHPTKYNGHNPVKKYIANKDTGGCIRAMGMIEEVDAGELIHQENFETPICNTYADFYNIALPYYCKTLEKTLEKLGI